MTTENIPIPSGTISAIRSLLSKQGGQETDLPGFVDQVLRREVLHGTVAQIKRQNAIVEADMLQREIDEAVDWARESRT